MVHLGGTGGAAEGAMVVLRGMMHAASCTRVAHEASKLMYHPSRCIIHVKTWSPVALFVRQKRRSLRLEVRSEVHPVLHICCGCAFSVGMDVILEVRANHFVVADDDSMRVQGQRSGQIGIPTRKGYGGQSQGWDASIHSMPEQYMLGDVSSSYTSQSLLSKRNRESNSAFGYDDDLSSGGLGMPPYLSQPIPMQNHLCHSAPVGSHMLSDSLDMDGSPSHSIILDDWERGFDMEDHKLTSFLFTGTGSMDSGSVASELMLSNSVEKALGEMEDRSFRSSRPGSQAVPMSAAKSRRRTTPSPLSLGMDSLDFDQHSGPSMGSLAYHAQSVSQGQQSPTVAAASQRIFHHGQPGGGFSGSFQNLHQMSIAENHDSGWNSSGSWENGLLQAHEPVQQVRSPAG